MAKDIKRATVINQGDRRDLDLVTLLPELARLHSEMLQQAKSLEHYVAIRALSEAELSAKGNTATVLDHLKKAGN